MEMICEWCDAPTEKLYKCLVEGKKLFVCAYCMMDYELIKNDKGDSEIIDDA